MTPLFRLRIRLRAKENECQTLLVTLEQGGGAQFASGPAIYSSREQILGKPSEIAFHLLKWFDQVVGTLNVADVQTVSNSCGISREEALEAVKELWNANYIRTIDPGAGEWNGRYCITDIGNICVRRFAT